MFVDMLEVATLVGNCSPNIALMVFDFVVATRVTLNPFT
jgi:hypothetical protein